MITYIRDSIRGFAAPEHQVSIAKPLWKKLRRELAKRGSGTRESGAFLLGRFDRKGRRVIERFVPYDDIDPHALDTGIIDIDGTHMEKLFDMCRAVGLSLMADVHTHPGAPYQSRSDQNNPVVARKGHVAIILPNFAVTDVKVSEIGLYCYLGNRQWDNWSGQTARRKLLVGF